MIDIYRAARHAREVLDYVDRFLIMNKVIREELVKDAIADLDKALAQPEQYDQTELELCDTCGWKTLIPDDCCLNCERNNFKQFCVKQCEKQNGHCYLGVNHD